MMLSPSAARIGTTSARLRELAKKRPPGCRFFNSRNGFSSFRHGGNLSSKAIEVRSKALSTNARAFFSTTSDVSSTRWKSTMASYDFDNEDDDEEVKHNATTRTIGVGTLSHEEVWMVNLGRSDNNEWLTGPRDPDEWFTGKQPKICPGVDAKGIIRSLPLPRLDAVTRENAMEYFDNSWTLYETLFAGLNGEEYLYRPPPHGLRHPQIFYYGHTACLYINKLRVSGALNKPCNAYFESIFEVGVY
jgi:hypothetical protein